MNNIVESQKLNCKECHYMHENGNCTAVGGFCTAVPAAHCKLIPELNEEIKNLKISLNTAQHELIKARYWTMRLADSDWCSIDADDLDAALELAKSVINGLQKPSCFHSAEDSLYPLCSGKDEHCAHCCFWSKYDPSEEELRAKTMIEKDLHQ